MYSCLDDLCHNFLRGWLQKVVRIHLHPCCWLAVATNLRALVCVTFFSHFLSSWAAKRLPDCLMNSSRRTWSEGFCELLRIRDWDINICCFCELTSSPSCGSKFPGLGRTGEISSRCFDLLLCNTAGWPLIPSGGTQATQITLHTVTDPLALGELSKWCVCHMQDVGMQDISSWFGFGEPSFVEVRRFLLLPWNVCPLLRL